MSIFPGLAIMLAVLGFNLLGDGLRDALDPQLRGPLSRRPRSAARLSFDQRTGQAGSPAMAAPTVGMPRRSRRGARDRLTARTEGAVMTRPTIYETPRAAGRPGETVVTSTCGHNCGGRCVVNAHVVDGRIVKISTDPRKWTFELPPLHACVRGFGAGRARLPSRPAQAAAAPDGPARLRAVRAASRGTPRSTRWRARCCASATRTATPRSSTPPARATCPCSTTAPPPSASSTCSAAAPSSGRTCRRRRRSSRCT